MACSSSYGPESPIKTMEAKNQESIYLIHLTEMNLTPLGFKSFMQP